MKLAAPARVRSFDAGHAQAHHSCVHDRCWRPAGVDVGQVTFWRVADEDGGVAIRGSSMGNRRAEEPKGRRAEGEPRPGSATLLHSYSTAAAPPLRGTFHP
ncbi:protein of unknown function [Paraburkholderia kururiensis]